MPAAEDTPYEEVTDLAYGAHAATFEVEQPDPHTIVLRGTCPRCGHAMAYRIIDQVVRRPAATGGEEPASTEETMMCTCGAEHADRPQDYVGCGAFWNLTIS